MKTIDFLVYCIENYKNKKNITGKETIMLFNKYDILDYININYEALHTPGKEYIIEDLDLYINTKKQM